jgi:hypothetical protein
MQPVARSVADQVTDRAREDIPTGRFRPGDRLMVADLEAAGADFGGAVTEVAAEPGRQPALAEGGLG